MSRDFLYRISEESALMRPFPTFSIKVKHPCALSSISYPPRRTRKKEWGRKIMRAKENTTRSLVSVVRRSGFGIGGRAQRYRGAWPRVSKAEGQRTDNLGFLLPCRLSLCLRSHLAKRHGWILRSPGKRCYLRIETEIEKYGFIKARRPLV